MAPDSVWEIVFLMVILKIPIVYLCVVVWYAVKAKPDPRRGDALGVLSGPDEPWPGRGHGRRRTPRRPLRPHGGPARAYARSPRVAVARAGRVGRR